MKLPIRPIIVLETNPKEIEKNQIIRISARLFDQKTLHLIEVSRIFMSIISLTDGNTVWDLSVIRKNASGFDIGIATQEMKQGHQYLVRVSNNWNLSPSATTVFAIKKAIFPAILIPILLSPLFLRKYRDRGINDVNDLTKYLRDKGWSEEQVKQEIDNILSEVEDGTHVIIPVDDTRRIVTKQWTTEQDQRVCKLCKAHTNEGPWGNGTWIWDDPNAPSIYEHYKCRCNWDLQYAKNRDNEFKTAAIMSRFYDMEDMEDAITIINNIR